MISAVIRVSLRRVWHICSLPCVYVLFRLISVARYAFKSPRICFRGTKYEVHRERVCLLALEFARTNSGILMNTTPMFSDIDISSPHSSRRLRRLVVAAPPPLPAIRYPNNKWACSQATIIVPIFMLVSKSAQLAICLKFRVMPPD